MSLIPTPAGFCPSSFSMRLQTSQAVFASPFGGSEQVIDRGNDRWMVSLTLPARRFAQAAAIEAFISSMRGLTNTVALYHWIRKVPRGTMRGAPMAAPAAAGASSILVGTPSGSSLLAGDLIGVGGMLLMVGQDCVADGTGLVVPIANRLRLPLIGGEAVVWDRPTALFRLASQSAVQYIPGYSPEVSFDFVEAIG